MSCQRDGDLNEQYLVYADQDRKTLHMISLDGWCAHDPVICGKRWKALWHATNKKWKLLERQRCPVCFVLSCYGE
jgi:hypothetical protein